MRISDWSSDVCSSDLLAAAAERPHAVPHRPRFTQRQEGQHCMAKTPHLDTIRLERAKLESRLAAIIEREKEAEAVQRDAGRSALLAAPDRVEVGAMERSDARRSEEHTSELQSLMRISYAVVCWKKK